MASRLKLGTKSIFVVSRGTSVSVAHPSLFGCGQIFLGECEAMHIGQGRAEITVVMNLSSPRGSPVILVADSDVFARNFLIRELSREGYFVLGAANSEEAVALSKTFADKIHLLLSNTGLQGRRALTDRITQERPKIRVIVISAATHAELIERGRARSAPSGQRTVLPETLSRNVRRALTAAEFSDAAEV